MNLTFFYYSNLFIRILNTILIMLTKTMSNSVVPKIQPEMNSPYLLSSMKMDIIGRAITYGMNRNIHMMIIRTPDKKFMMSLLLFLTICSPIATPATTSTTPPPILNPSAMPLPLTYPNTIPNTPIIPITKMPIMFILSSYLNTM